MPENLLIESIKLDDFSSKNRTLKSLAEKISKKYSTNKNEVLHSLMEREMICNTRLEKGIATPHIILSSKIPAKIIITKLNKQVDDWICLDNTKVDLLVCLICSKDNVSQEELKRMKKIYSLLGDELFIEKITKINNENEIVKIFRNLV